MAGAVVKDDGAGAPPCGAGALCGSGCPYVAVAPETTTKARRPALSMCVIHCRVTSSRLVVPTDLDNILLTFALGNIRKRFQSTPNALETCLLQHLRFRPNGSSRRP